MEEFNPEENKTSLRNLIVPSGIDDDYEYTRVYDELEIGSTYYDVEDFANATGKSKFWASSKSITLSTFSKKRFVITDDGRLGIGELSPESILHLGNINSFERQDAPQQGDGYEGDGYEQDTDEYLPYEEQEDVYITFKDQGRIGCDYESGDLIFESYGDSNIKIGGGLCTSIRTISNDYIVDSSERKDHTILVDSSVSNISITLPTKPANGRVLIIKDKGSASVNNIEVKSSNMIEGFTPGTLIYSLVLNTNRASVSLVWSTEDNSWWITSQI